MDLVRVVLAPDGAPATSKDATAEIAWSDAIDKQDDKEDEKRQREHEWLSSPSRLDKS